MKTTIIGCGGYLPAKIVSNHDLAATLETSDEWIRQRTGIGARHLAAAEELTSDLGTAAAREAIANAGVTLQEIDFIIVATTTPDQTFPATAVHIQRKLGITRPVIAFDVQAVCSGFVYALTVAEKFISSGQSRCGLVIGAETMSRILDWHDRSTCVLFGDGAGAVVLAGVAPANNATVPALEPGFMGSDLGADGNHYHILQVKGGPSSSEQVGKLTMDGPEVFKRAIGTFVSSAGGLLQRHGLTTQDVRWFVAHQANIRIIESVAKHMQLAPEQLMITVENHANTSAASIPLALWSYRDQIKPGDLVLMSAFGAGLTWGSILWRW